MRCYLTTDNAITDSFKLKLFSESVSMESQRGHCRVVALMPYKKEPKIYTKPDNVADNATFCLNIALSLCRG